MTQDPLVETPLAENPLTQAWTAPFGLPPFDRIRPAHFPAALERAMEEREAEVAAIAGSAEPPSFANTVEALERSGRLLRRVGAVFSNLLGSRSDGEMEAVARDYAPKLARHASRVALDPGLFARVADLHARRASLGLDPDQMRLLERLHLLFVRAGAALSGPDKARMAEITARLASLQTLFGQNVLHDERQWQLVLDEADLDGLPDFAREAAAGAARERGLDGRRVVTLARSSIEAFLTFSTRRDLRRLAYEAWSARGAGEISSARGAGEISSAHDNRPLLREIAALRAEQAALLGYPSYAHFRLADSMAKTPDAVEGLLSRVWEPARARAGAERRAIEAAARADGMNGAVEPWDWRHYAEKVRRAEYDLDEAEVKPYLVLDDMVRAAFDVAGRLFGITFEEREGLPLYHPDVRAYEVKGADGRHVGLFLHDNFARPGKRSGAWMNSYRLQESFDGEVAPIVVNNNNFAKGAPTLLSFDDARTLFHEFGHALHGLLSRVRYPSQSGTSVRRDFVEFPSQVYEHWLEVPEILRRYARHYRTGEPMPDALLDRLLASRTFDQGFATVEYTASALLDLELHRHRDPGSLDPDGFEREVLARIGMPDAIRPRHRPAHFQHLFAGDGYAAGYYAYLWAEVLDADGFGAFEETGDAFDPGLAARLGEVYSAGDTRDPMDLYVAFRGRGPDIGMLLKKRGLVH
ncbi:M3 family metallopeptidase [Arenibaculum sp.]|uniref:M3 family metallopeptidase n=1 Tax=Arenibaculum sp. TaxID=2865862 RepID=UPI002E150A7F|nr:M3 family metallopeptidase [Arenibaculum sp.]